MIGPLLETTLDWGDGPNINFGPIIIVLPKLVTIGFEDGPNISFGPVMVESPEGNKLELMGHKRSNSLF